jgi:hypothetical protein
MRRFAVIGLSLVAGCSQKAAPVKVDTTFNATMASQTLDAAPFKLGNMRVSAVCGPSEGRGIFETDKFEQWQADGISGGRLIFVSELDGSGANVIFRDASGSFTSALADGGEVRVLNEGRTWVVIYPATGVSEVHNLQTRDGRLINVNTVNKPTSLIGASAKIFIANCQRP